MRLYVLESTNGATTCVGMVAKDLSSLKKMMNFRTDLITTDADEYDFETLPDEKFEEYNKEQAKKYSWPYEPWVNKYKLIFECDVSDNLKEDCVFRVEE